MRSARVIGSGLVSNLPGQDAGDHWAIVVYTDHPTGQPNAFFIERVDLAGRPVELPIANQPPGTPVDPEALNVDDPIEFDIGEGLFHTKVRWKGREIRQRDMSFDARDPQHTRD